MLSFIRVIGLSVVATLVVLYGSISFAEEVADSVPNGVVIGKISSFQTGEYIPEAAVILKNTDISAKTDAQGLFYIKNLPAGSYVVVVTSDGYKPSSEITIEVKNEGYTRADVRLSEKGAKSDVISDSNVGAEKLPDNNREEEENLSVGGDVVKLAEFTVVSEVTMDGALGLLKERRELSTVTNSIGADSFSTLGIGDAAEALSKITGASVVDDKFVLVRGMGDRYTNTTLNKSTVPTSDPDKRVVQMDQFPSSLIESITVSKSFTPDLPGGFSGGNVNVKTKSFPEHYFLSFSASSSYNTNATGEDILTVPGGKNDWLGFDDGSRGLPDGIPDDIPSQSQARLAARDGDFGPAQELARVSNLFDNRTYFPTANSADPNIGFSVAVGDSIHLSEEGDRLFGYVFSLTYDRDSSHYSNGASSRYLLQGADTVETRLSFSPNAEDYSFVTGGSTILGPSGEEPKFGVTSSTQSVNLGVFSKIAFQPSANHQFALDAFYNQSADDTVKRGIGEERGNYTGLLYQVYDLLYTERGIGSLQLSGESLFPDWNNTKVEWRVSGGTSSQDQPDYRTLSALYDFDFEQFDNNAGVSPNRFFREMQEDISEVGVDVTVPFSLWRDEEASVKFGGAYTSTDRDYSERRFFWSKATVQTQEELEAYPNPVGIVSINGNEIVWGNTITESTSLNNYTGSQTIAAVYGMVDYHLTKKLQMIAGLRVEKTEMETIPAKDAIRNPADGLIDETSYLPAINFVYRLSENSNLRAAYGWTIARPTYRELAEIRIEDVFINEVYTGNAALELTNIDNFDFRWEWYPNPGDVIAVGLFYKYMFDPIEVLIVPRTGSITPQNVEEGEVYGMEFEFRRSLEFLSPRLENFSIGANFSLIESQVSIPAPELESIRLLDPDAADTRDLLGQSPYLVNFDTTYSNSGTGTSLTLSFNVAGERLSLVTDGALPDVYEQPAPLLNLIFSQRIGNRWTLNLNARNLLDPDKKKTIDFHGQELIYESYNRGRSFSIGLSYMFE